MDQDKNSELYRSVQEMNRKRAADQKIAALEKQLKYLQGREARHKANLDAASAQVEQILRQKPRGKGASSPAMDAALDQNRRKMYQEQLNYSSIVSQIKSVEADLQEEQEKCAALAGCEERYEAVMGKHRQEVLSTNPEAIELEERARGLDSDVQIIRDVIKVCQEAQKATDDAYLRLQEFKAVLEKNFIFGKKAKQKKASDLAMQSVDNMLVEVRRFQNELLRIQEIKDAAPEYDGRFLKFADYFFDDIFLTSDDCYDVVPVINKVERVRWTLEDTEENLTRALGITLHRQEYLRDRRQELPSSYFFQN